MSIELDDHLNLERCPHCSIYKPNLLKKTEDLQTNSAKEKSLKIWRVYSCSNCGGAVLAGFVHNAINYCRYVHEIYPCGYDELDNSIPSRVRKYLQQAIDSTSSPDGSIMLCASSVDAILKEKNLTEGSLYKRIDEAYQQGILTIDMKTWAHQVRLEANDQRHSDNDSTHATIAQAKQAIEFTKTLAEILFVLPSKVTRGLEDSKH
jgi:hypothetical protein